MNAPALPRLLEPAELQAHLDDPDVRVLDVCSAEAYTQGHIPGAVHLSPDTLTTVDGHAKGALPSLETLSAVFSRVGLTPDTHVVATDDEGGGWAGRLLWTLALLGHERWSYLNGGTVAWRGAGLPLSDAPVLPEPGEYTAELRRPELRVTADQLQTLIAEEAVTVWDARSAAEYDGSRVLAARGGHIPGARHLEWTDLMDRLHDLRLRDTAALNALIAEHGITPDKPIVTHCQTHHRSGLTWLAGTLLGWDIRAYDGAWSDWGNRDDTPVTTGPLP